MTNADHKVYWVDWRMIIEGSTVWSQHFSQGNDWYPAIVDYVGPNRKFETVITLTFNDGTQLKRTVEMLAWRKPGRDDKPVNGDHR